MERDDISLLEEELVHLTVKSSPVVSNGNPTLLGTFDDEKDLELILAGRPWLFRQNLVIFKKLDKAMEISNLHLVEFPFWLKIGPCPLECENKDLTHAIGSTFEGIISSEINGDFCRINVELDVQKPLLRGIFILAGMQGKSWVPFKYENLPRFCFGCGRMGHVIKERKDTLDESKEFLRDDLPFSLALKAESSLMGKLRQKVDDSEGQFGNKEGRNQPGLSLNERNDKVFYSKISNSDKIDQSGPLIWASPLSATKMGQVDSSHNIIDEPNGLRKWWRRIGNNTPMDQSEGAFTYQKKKRDWERLKDLGSLFVVGLPTRRNKNLILECPWFEKPTGSASTSDLGAEGTKNGLCLAGKEEVDIILKSFYRNYIDVMERGNLPQMNIRKRLDRGVVNTNWLERFSNAS
ncbi:hypothetical protein Goari_018356, partial [Gossypium aridum]|nr:hypothetical protein [Gossypium aridum]